MSKDFYIRIQKAGRYFKVVRYQRPLPKDGHYARAAKTRATSKAQHFINCKNAAERLQLLLCCNFDRKEACFCTFTYNETSLPESRKAARKDMVRFLSVIRADYKQRGKELKYIYTVEGEPLSVFPTATPVKDNVWEVQPWKAKEKWDVLGPDRAEQKEDSPSRLHIHAFLLLPKAEYETVRALWTHGHVYISRMKVNAPDTFIRLSYYATKEQREGKTQNGERVYTPSLNLEKPTIEGRWCSAFETIEPPKRAEILFSERIDTLFSSYAAYFYRVEREQTPPTQYQNKRKLYQKQRIKAKKRACLVQRN